MTASARAAWAALALLTGVSAAAPWLSPHDPVHQYRDFPHARPQPRFLLGTDEYGRDLLSRLLHAGRWSLLASGLAVSLSLSLGALLGLAASQAPRAVEMAILWTADLTQSLPWLYLLFALRGLLPMALPPEAALVAVIALVGCAGWATPARLVRSVAQNLLTADFVRAARAFGASRRHVLLRHAAPALGSVLAAQAFVLFPRYVLAESALSLLGLGLAEPTPTWGTLLAGARQAMARGLDWWLLAPLAPIMILTLAAGALAAPSQEAV